MSKIAIVKDLLDQAGKNLQQSRKILSEMTGEVSKVPEDFYTKQASGVVGTSRTGERIIEGIFNGQEMIDSNGTTYPIPVNYSSKSKLVPGDALKLIINPDGRFLYKQIGPVLRTYLTGPLSCENNQYQVLADGKIFKVLLASVTYFKAEVGDEVTIIIPKDQKTEWASIDAVLPKFQNIITDNDLDSDLDINQDNI